MYEESGYSFSMSLTQYFLLCDIKIICFAVAVAILQYSRRHNISRGLK